MNHTVTLTPMTPEMYHAFFREYRNDPDLYLDQAEYFDYVYCAEAVDRYIQKQIDRKRLPFAIMADGEMVGELKLYDIVPHCSATLGITMKHAGFKNRGYGTQAERLAVEYAFRILDVPVVYADSIVTNSRSQHVLEKVGFRLIREDQERKYYRITREEEK